MSLDDNTQDDFEEDSPLPTPLESQPGILHLEKIVSASRYK